MYRLAERRRSCLWCDRCLRGSNMARHVRTHYCGRCERYHTQRGFAFHHGTAKERERAVAWAL